MNHHRCAIVVLAIVLVALALPACAAPIYPDRWVYVSNTLRDDAQMAAVCDIVRTAAAHGLNGMVWSAGLDAIERQGPDYLRRLLEVKKVCDENGVQIVPMIFSVGYGGAVLGYNPNLAAGLPVRDLPMLVTGAQAQVIQDPAEQPANPDFEQHNGNNFPGFRFHDKPGQISFADENVAHSGKCSIRFENLDGLHARVMCEVKVRPYTRYRVQAWVKTQGFGPASSLRFQAYVGDRAVATADCNPKPDMDWTPVAMTFNSMEGTTIRLYFGAWGGKEGRFWIDDITMNRCGLRNVLRRPGTPVKVTSEDGKTVYEEGKDFARIEDPRLRDFAGNHEDPPIRILPGSSIRDGQRLAVSYYHGSTVQGSQVSVCMSEPELYEYWARQVQRIHEILAPKAYFLSMDEIRQGGSCEACKARNMTMGEILGDCITRQQELIRKVNPQARCYIWSDMLDPNHNAHGNYYVVEGDFTGSWLHIPRDMVIACWYYSKRAESLKFFSDLGFETLAGAYYDGDDLENCKGWLAQLDLTPKARGIMYTSWRNKYALLPAFGDLVSKR